MRAGWTSRTLGTGRTLRAYGYGVGLEQPNDEQRIPDLFYVMLGREACGPFGSSREQALVHHDLDYDALDTRRDFDIWLGALDLDQSLFCRYCSDLLEQPAWDVGWHNQFWLFLCCQSNW